MPKNLTVITKPHLRRRQNLTYQQYQRLPQISILIRMRPARKEKNKGVISNNRIHRWVLNQDSRAKILFLSKIETQVIQN